MNLSQIINQHFLKNNQNRELVMENQKISNIDLEIKSIKLQTFPTILIDGKSIPIEYETANQLHLLECIRQEIKLSDAHKPLIAWQLIKNTTIALATEYPTLVHFALAREALLNENVYEVDRNSKEYKDIVIQVATLFNEHCQKLKLYFSFPNELKEIAKKNNYDMNQDISHIDIINWDDLLPSANSYFSKNNLFTIDYDFLNYLQKIGKNGKKISDELKPMLIEHYEQFHKSKKYPLPFWFNINSTPEQPIIFAPAWIAIIKALWRDEISNKAKLRITGIPTIIENDQKHIIDLVSRDKEINTTTGPIQIFTHGKLLGEIPIVTIKESTINAILKSIHKMKLVEGHRVLRYITRTAFNQAINGDPDYRIIRRESFPEIAKELGIKGHTSIKNMADVFNVMAYFEFKRENFSGNLIALKRFKSKKTHRMDGVEITVGTNLLPYRACEDFKNGESNLMIPILPDPILIGANQYHAGQYHLQMLIMGEFVRQSKDFAKHGYIKISNEDWHKMAQDCGVEPILSKILNQWTQDNKLGPKFLEKKDNNFYTLGSSYKKVTDFLIAQGNRRINQSNRGILSAAKKLKTKNKI